MSIQLNMHKTRSGGLKVNRLRPQPVKKRKPIWYRILQIVFLVFAGLALFKGGQMFVQTSQVLGDIGYKFSMPSITKEPRLKTDSTGKYTNVLVVGMDKRGENSGLENTDSIIIASYNYDTNNIVMISIPRDTMVMDENGYWHKINSIYSTAEHAQPGSGMSVLKDYVEDYTGLEIQYWGLIDLNGFREIIDTIGGVDIDVENKFVDNNFPNEWDNGYITVEFEAGLQHMDGETALQYARSRHAQITFPGYEFEGSDFARARRQQKVIDAVRAKLLSTDGLLSTSKFNEILGNIRDNIQLSTFNTNDVQAAISLIKKTRDANTYSFVLDPSIGGLNRIITTNVPIDGYAIAPSAGIGNTDEIHEFVRALLENPAMYSENASIRVYDIGVGYTNGFEITQQLQDENPYLDIVYMGTLRSDQENSYVYTNSSKDTVQTRNFIADQLQVANRYKPNFIMSTLNSEDVSVLLGSDRLDSNTQ